MAGVHNLCYDTRCQAQAVVPVWLVDLASSTPVVLILFELEVYRCRFTIGEAQL